MRSHASFSFRLVALVAFVGLPGLTACNLLDKKLGKDGGAAVADDGGLPSTKAASAAPGADGAHHVDGVGAIVAWAPDKGSAPKCTPSPAATARFKAIEKGDDAQLVAGTADAAALTKEVGGDTCFAARKGLADALNNGGYKRYGLKKFDEASRFWRTSLAVRPAFLLARYNLACGLALAGHPKDAVTEILEIARASREGDASASNFLEKAKTDDDLKSVREDGTFKEALHVSQGTLIGPRKGASEPEVGQKAIPLLPEEFRKFNDKLGGTGVTTFKPAVVNVWTWHPDKATELVVTSITDDPARLGKPHGDSEVTYGAVAVYRRDGEKLALLLAHKTADLPPALAAGKNGSVAYTFEAACGTLSGTLTWTGKAVDVKEKRCEDL
jgi:hypothetical protein